MDCQPFAERLRALREQLGASEFEWYPFDSFGSYRLLEKLPAPECSDIRRLCGAGPVLELCCADGDLSFFLESEGCRVHAVDWPLTNHNYLRGFRRLHQALGSRVELHELDLDGRFELPGDYYTLAFFLGGLYHLKNPFYILEQLAERSYYCVLSTRVARWTPDRTAEMRAHPLAYLAAADEFANDDSNFWVFSETGLRRLLDRSGWKVIDWTTFGDSVTSDPLDPGRDERAYCLLRSKRLSPDARVILLEGWHQVEESAWRWTERKFAVSVHEPGAGLRLRGLVPEGLAPVTLSAAFDGEALPALNLTSPGEFVYAASLPQAVPSVMRLEFELSAAQEPNDRDRRQRGIIVKSENLQMMF